MSTTDYAGMFVYKDRHIDHVITSEGRMSSSGLSQATDYYPFGLEIPVYGVNDNQIKYNSKELQTEAKLNWYDYGARFYDPVIGRWHVVDPMAETSRRWSPYTYCMNNPIRYIDPDGMRVDNYFDENGNYLFTDTKTSDYIKIINSKDWKYISSEYQTLINNKSQSFLELDNILNENSKSLQQSGISSQAISKIFTNIIGRMVEVGLNNISNDGQVNILQYYWTGEGPISNEHLIYGDAIFTMAPFSTSFKKDGSINLTARMDQKDMRLFETVSNIQNALGVHEYLGHGIDKIGESDHYKAYEKQFEDATWEKTTDYFQNYMKMNYEDYLKLE